MKHDIVKVELIVEDTVSGSKVPKQFLVYLKDDLTAVVPLEPTTRHYGDVKEWFDEQSDKPFKWPKTPA